MKANDTTKALTMPNQKEDNCSGKKKGFIVDRGDMEAPSKGLKGDKSDPSRVKALSLWFFNFMPFNMTTTELLMHIQDDSSSNC
jgi:hypothetical protein